ncbi:MoaD/ThiS family protein [Burkholderiaceae bacterium DAT-1]|nr:MoaD/ThiS family protein [Burkholderiaceae bacterium DAT-1]
MTPSIITVQLRYFARLRETFARSQEAVSLQEPTLAALFDLLHARGGVWADELSGHRIVRIAINQEMHTSGDCTLKEGDEIALFPPVTGG